MLDTRHPRASPRERLRATFRHLWDAPSPALADFLALAVMFILFAILMIAV
ncbi:hypothetical protein [Planktothrix phage Pra-JY27]|nr:hypothetical protein [Planktothrix phage Pag-Yong1]WEV89262.1 hypothetical protein [Synechococcus phage MinM2]